MQFLDSHAHLMGEEYKEDLDAVVARLEQNHIAKVMIITLDNEETERAIAFAKKDPIRYTVAAGIFPEDVKKATPEYRRSFEEIVSRPEVQVIGEIGLDYYWVKDVEERKAQRELFAWQMDLARKLQKPIAVHARDAIQDTYDLMKEHRCHGLLHCFSGSKEMAKEFTKLGYYIALGGALTFKNARHSVEVAETVDETFLLTETDCPYMSPVPVRGTRNEPSNIPYILKKMSEVRGVSEEYMSERVMQNWENYLNLK